MKFKGVIIEESLDDKSILGDKDIKIVSIKVEKVLDKMHNWYADIKNQRFLNAPKILLEFLMF